MLGPAHCHPGGMPTQIMHLLTMDLQSVRTPQHICADGPQNVAELSIMLFAFELVLVKSSKPLVDFADTVECITGRRRSELKATA